MSSRDLEVGTVTAHHCSDFCERLYSLQTASSSITGMTFEPATLLMFLNVNLRLIFLTLPILHLYTCIWPSYMAISMAIYDGHRYVKDEWVIIYGPKVLG